MPTLGKLMSPEPGWKFVAPGIGIHCPVPALACANPLVPLIGLAQPTERPAGAGAATLLTVMTFEFSPTPRVAWIAAGSPTMFSTRTPRSPRFTPPFWNCRYFSNSVAFACG